MATRKEILSEYKKRIEYLKNLTKAIYRKGVVVDEKNGTVDVKMSASELEKVVEIERKIFAMEQEALMMEENALESEDILESDEVDTEEIV
jgi:hypothetical protein